jgi:hypothetical protein
VKPDRVAGPYESRSRRAVLSCLYRDPVSWRRSGNSERILRLPVSVINPSIASKAFGKPTDRAVSHQQSASRARRRVQGGAAVPAADRNQQRGVVDAFLAALRGGDVEGLLAVLDPDVVVRIDETGARPGAPREIRGARNWAKGAVAFSQLARLRNRRWLTETWRLSLLQGVGCSGSSSSRSRKGRLRKSTWSPTRRGCESSILRFSMTDPIFRNG